MRVRYPDEFVPLPFYGWAERPLSLPLDDDEAATALYLARRDSRHGSSEGPAIRSSESRAAAHPPMR